MFIIVPTRVPSEMHANESLPQTSINQPTQTKGVGSAPLECFYLLG